MSSEAACLCSTAARTVCAQTPPPSLLATSPEGEEADRQARRKADASWQADLAIIEQARKARFGEMSVHIEQPNGGPRIRVL